MFKVSSHKDSRLPIFDLCFFPLKARSFESSFWERMVLWEFGWGRGVPVYEVAPHFGLLGLGSRRRSLQSVVIHLAWTPQQQQQATSL